MVGNGVISNKKKLTILVYRRTHKGDPSENGIFGINNCMGQVRDWNYDAVIGIGGVAPWRDDRDIEKRINWIGINPKKHKPSTFGQGFLNSCITFEKFKLFDGAGNLVEEYAPKLFEYMFKQGRIPRAGKNFNDEIYAELLDILSLADDANASKGIDTHVEVKNKTCKPLNKIATHQGCSK